MTTNENRAERQPISDYTQVDKALTGFTNKLLEQATVHNDAWRRGIFRVDSEKIPSLYTALSQYPFRRLIPRPGSEIPLIEDPRLPKQQPMIAPELPDGITIGVEAFDHRPIRDWHEEILRITLHYKGDDPNFIDSENEARVLLEISLGNHELYKRVLMNRYIETGYDGHEFDTIELSPDDLTKFLQLAVDNLGELIPQQSFQDFFRKLVYVDNDSGKKFRYDAKRDTHVAEDGMTMEEYQSPLVEYEEEMEGIGGEDESPLKTVALFRIEFEE